MTITDTDRLDFLEKMQMMVHPAASSADQLWSIFIPDDSHFHKRKAKDFVIDGKGETTREAIDAAILAMEGKE